MKRTPPRAQTARLVAGLLRSGFLVEGFAPLAPCAAPPSPHRPTRREAFAPPSSSYSPRSVPFPPPHAARPDAPTAAPTRAAAAPLLARALALLERRYAIEAVLGRGGMGAVYRARERASGRAVALKVATSSLGPVRRRRFRREGMVTAALRHPGIVRVHAAGEAQGVPYLVYELVEGGCTLEALLDRSSLRQRLGWLRDAARALGYAHARGIVHRDVKPSNLLLDADGRLRVADFGLAAVRGLERITREHVQVGTPVYMAPEQVLGRRSEQGPATDVWALGVILYRSLTGRLPFDQGDLPSLQRAIL
ncbi:MAG: serine/threonine protein kinase, partial [Planctomycetota bacterium]